MTASAAALAMLGVWLSAAETLPPGPAVPVPTSDMLLRAQILGREIRCPVCQGMPIGESPATMAQDMQAKVNQMVAQGASDAQVRDFFVARYGEWVLLDPPRHGITLWLWLLPWAFLCLGLGVAWRAYRGGRGGRGAAEATAETLPAPATPPPSPALLAQIRLESEP